jgi:hypothetical protein
MQVVTLRFKMHGALLPVTHTYIPIHGVVLRHRDNFTSAVTVYAVLTWVGLCYHWFYSVKWPGGVLIISCYCLGYDCTGKHIIKLCLLCLGATWDLLEVISALLMLLRTSNSSLFFVVITFPATSWCVCFTLLLRCSYDSCVRVRRLVTHADQDCEV